MHGPRLRSILGLAVLATPWAAQALEVYHWVDASGLAHLSDTRPDEGIEVTTIEVESGEAAYDAAADPYSVMNQAKRIHERWIDILAAARTRAEPDSAAPSSARTDRIDLHRAETRSYYLPGPPPYPPYRPSSLAREQARALQQLDLLGPRPASINSGAHRVRVARSRALPLIVGPPPHPR